MTISRLLPVSLRRVRDYRSRVLSHIHLPNISKPCVSLHLLRWGPTGRSLDNINFLITHHLTHQNIYEKVSIGRSSIYSVHVHHTIAELEPRVRLWLVTRPSFKLTAMYPHSTLIPRSTVRCAPTCPMVGCSFDVFSEASLRMEFVPEYHASTVSVVAKDLLRKTSHKQYIKKPTTGTTRCLFYKSHAYCNLKGSTSTRVHSCSTIGGSCHARSLFTL
jgi:hypothetical protein